MTNQEDIHRLLGEKNIDWLFQCIRKGSLRNAELRKMSFTQNLDILQTFQQCSEARSRPVNILEKMLEDWYEETGCRMSQTQARDKVLTVLENCCSQLVSTGWNKEVLSVGSGQSTSSTTPPIAGALPQPQQSAKLEKPKISSKVKDMFERYNVLTKSKGRLRQN